MDAVRSGTGVFYQAMPAVGADGKNIMKLIPVQMVNRQFVQNPISKPRMDSTSQKAVGVSSATVQMVKKTALNPSVTEQTVREQVAFVNACKKRSPQKRTVNLKASVPPIATLAAHSGKSARLLCQLPVTVKSPALPRGQYLQIPPNAHVQTVPASELPAGIKKQILTSSASSSPGSGFPSVVYVSPVQTVNQGLTPPYDSALHSFELLSKTSNKTSHVALARGSKQPLKLIPKVSQRPNSPIKWVIEEQDSSVAPNLNHFGCPSVISEFLQDVQETENTSQHCDIFKNSVSQSNQEKGGQGQENALVMYNGKVFFVATKWSLPFKMGKSRSPKAATKSSELNKTIVPFAQQTLKTVEAERQQDIRTHIPNESDEVIDLCDDDAQDDSLQQAAAVGVSAVCHQEDDNVIFVSYTPPKSEHGSTRYLIPKTLMRLEKEADQKCTSCSNSRTGEDRDKGGRPCQSIFISTVKSVSQVCSSAVMHGHDHQGWNTRNQQSTSTQQVERTEGNAETATCQKLEDSHNVESSPYLAPCRTSSLTPKPCQVTDHLLRQIFRITADVRIRLQRVDEASSESGPTEPLNTDTVSSVEDHQEPANGLKDEELIFQDLYQPCKKQTPDNYGGLIDVQRVNVLIEQEPPADLATPTPHTDITPLKCPPFSVLRNKCHSGQGLLKEASCDVENAAVIGYWEPIDDDILESQDTAAQLQMCVDRKTSTRRIGRTRKRTVCPCCIPGALEPAVKSSTRLAQMDTGS